MRFVGFTFLMVVVGVYIGAWLEVLDTFIEARRDRRS
jgi:hypothetical protein